MDKVRFTFYVDIVMLYKHHIVPKHAGGSNEPSNIKMVTCEEHAEEHRKLYEQYGRWQDKVAWMGWAGMIGKEEINFLKNSLAHKGNTINLGRKLSDDTKMKISLKKRGNQNRLGVVLSEETKRKIGVGNSGPHLNGHANKTEEHKRKLSASKQGKDVPSLRKSYVVTFPDGRINTVIGLVAFAESNTLNAGNLLGLSGSRGYFAKKVGI